VTYGEAWQTAGLRIENTMHLQGDAARQMRDVLASNSQGVDLSSTFNLAAQVGPSLQERGFGVRDVEQIVQTLNQLAAVSGTAGGAASRAFYQLSQAFALGRLQGQDLRILIEDMPPLFGALAEATGKSRAELEQMAHAGQLSSDVLAQGLLRIAPEVAQQYQGLGANVSRALTDVTNAFEETAGRAADDTGAIQALGGGIEEFANLLKSDAVRGVFGSLLQFMGDLGKGVTDSANQIRAAVGAVQGAIGAIDTSTPAGKFAQADRLQKEAQGIQAQAAGLGPDTIAQKFEGPTDRRARQQAQADAFEPRAAIEAQQLRMQGLVQGIGAAGDEGAASRVAVPLSGVAEQLQGLIDKDKTRLGIEQQLKDLANYEKGLVKDRTDYAEQESAVTARRAQLEQQLATARKGEDVDRLAKMYGLGRQEAEKLLGVGNNIDQGLTGRAAILAKIGELQKLSAAFPQREVVYSKEIAQERQKLAQIDQQRTETLANQRDAVLAQGTAAEKLAAAEDKIARERRPNAQGQTVLNTPALVGTAQRDAYEKYAAAVVSDADKTVKGQDQRVRLQTEINALQLAENQHGEARVQVEERLGVAKAALVALDEKDASAIDAALQSADRQYQQAELALNRLKRGGSDVQAQVEEAGRTARESVKDLDPEKQAAPGGAGAQARIEMTRELVGLDAEAAEKLRIHKEALQAVGDPMQALADEQGRLNDLLRAGVISSDQYEAALRRRTVAANQASRQQHISDLLNTGEPGSGVGLGGQVAAGAQAAGLQYVEQYGNVAKATAGALTEMGQDGVDALLQLSQGAEVSAGAVVKSLALIIEKTLLTIAVARLLQAAFGGSPAANTAAIQQPGGGFVNTADIMSAYGHTGGTVETLGNRRAVDPMLFAGAPRYHAGGMIGPGEYPIIAKAGERVLTPDQSRQWSGGGGAPVVNVNVQNHAGADVSAGSARRNPDGSMSLDVIVERKVNDLAARGRLDKGIRGRYGVDKQLQG
jgi:tape measure domain-containing protein